MNPYTCFLAAGFTLILATNLSAQSNAPLLTVSERLSSGAEPVKIVCVGDSITGTYYHTGSRRAYCDMLGLTLRRIYPQANLTVLNAGVSGYSTVEVLARLDHDVLSYDPDLVTIMLGMNDIHEMSAATYYANLLQIVQRCQDQGAEVVLCTPNPTFSDPERPAEKWAALVAAIHRIAQKRTTMLADCFAAYSAIHDQDPQRYNTLLSDGAHPNMNGHKVFAEEIAYAISGQRVSLQDVPPLPCSVGRTLLRQTAGLPIRVIAMPPYDELIKGGLAALPLRKTQPEVTSWPVAGKTLAELAQWAQDHIRQERPDLVIVAVPAEAAALAGGQAAWQYQELLKASLDWGPGTWDCFVVLPAVTKPDLRPEERNAEDQMRQVTRSLDLDMVERPAGDQSSPAEIFGRWLQKQQEQWPGPTFVCQP